jgi:hypothetical protein
LFNARAFRERRKRRCSSTVRHLILGNGLSWACTRAPLVPRVCTGRWASETGPHACRVPTATLLSKTQRSDQSIHFSCVPAREPGGGSGLIPGITGGGPGRGPARFHPAPLGSNWQLGVRCVFHECHCEDFLPIWALQVPAVEPGVLRPPAHRDWWLVQAPRRWVPHSPCCGCGVGALGIGGLKTAKFGLLQVIPQHVIKDKGHTGGLYSLQLQ